MTRYTRRELLLGGAAAAGLVLGFQLIRSRKSSPASPLEPFAEGTGLLAVAPDGRITVSIGSSELGQGVLTALGMIVADELGSRWNQINVVVAVADPVFANPLMGRQRTAWSASVRAWWRPLRRVAAQAREMLVMAAATEWGVAASECRAEDGAVTHPGSGRSAPLETFATSAGRLPRPDQVALRSPSDWRLVGRSIPRLDIPDKIAGRTVYGADLKLPGLLYGAVLRSPSSTAALIGLDASRASRIMGVVQVVETAAGTMVLADSTWAAFQGRSALIPEWREAPSDLGSSPYSALERGFDGPDERILRSNGTPVRERKGETRRIVAEYRLPYLAHAPIEPMTCTARIEEGRCEIWLPTQDQTAARETAAQAAELPLESVTVHTTFVGGAFGARVHVGAAREAVLAARAMGRPVQVVYDRADEFVMGRARPATIHRLAAILGGDGKPSAWEHRISGGGGDAAAVIPYRLPTVHVSANEGEHVLRTGIWRAVDSSYVAFAIESFVDELSQAAQRDPVEYRLDLLPEDSRLRRVLLAAAKAAGWGQELPPNRARGVAIHEMVGTAVAEVAEIEMIDDRLRVRRVTAAVDCGIVINPDGVKAQIEGAVAMGLSAFLHERLTPARGIPEERNFDRYRILRFDEMPEVVVEILASEAEPGGVGEPGLPPIAPAVSNAIFALSGVRHRSAPWGQRNG